MPITAMRRHGSWPVSGSVGIACGLSQVARRVPSGVMRRWLLVPSPCRFNPQRSSSRCAAADSAATRPGPIRAYGCCGACCASCGNAASGISTGVPSGNLASRSSEPEEK